MNKFCKGLGSMDNRFSVVIADEHEEYREMLAAALEKTSELWRDRYRRQGEVDHTCFLIHLRQCLPRVFYTGI